MQSETTAGVNDYDFTKLEVSGEGGRGSGNKFQAVSYRGPGGHV